MSSTPSGNKSSSTETPLSEFSELNLGAHQDAAFGDLEINSVELVGNSPDTPAEQHNANQQNIVILPSRRRPAVASNNNEQQRNVRQRNVEQQQVEVVTGTEDLPEDHEWKIKVSTKMGATKNYAIDEGKFLIIGGRRVPCQMIGGNPLGINPLGPHRGHYNVPIYKNQTQNFVANILNVNHFVPSRGTQPKRAVMWWDIVDSDKNTNLEWLERTGFRIKEKDGVRQLFRGTFTGRDFKGKKDLLKRYGFYVGDEQGNKTGWPSGNNVKKWEDSVFPLYIHHQHKQGILFHGGDEGRGDAEKILCEDNDQKKARKRARLVMNHFYIVNPTLEPPSDNAVALESPHWLNLRYNRGEDVDIMWEQIVSGIINE